MKTAAEKKPLHLQAWAVLLALTGISLLLGASFGHARWMPLLVAALIWVKGMVVARVFLESRDIHPFIGWLLRIFIAFAPLALLLSAALDR
ncbi:MAG TPA: hypothetical protein VEC01_10580 [Noviherbaspirillum sp.]|uniref:hypothetical protein n=1 Tax=Noviherbaspirillum sp. TaxID=1926288 RepID=UPI002D62BEE3|nr:hypothetical protein [Noviherbaspirillum sp.]HYD95761.1 hypothetical protein [Noviherbaspirillum sp.]